MNINHTGDLTFRLGRYLMFGKTLLFSGFGFLMGFLTGLTINSPHHQE